MPFTLQLVAYAVCCAGVLALAGPGSRSFWLITLLLVASTGTYVVVEWHLQALQATWQAPLPQCVLRLDSRTLPLATFAQAAILLLLAGLGRSAACQVAVGSVVGTWVLLGGLVLYHPV